MDVPAPPSWDALLSHVRRDAPNLYRTWFDELPPPTMVHGELQLCVDDAGRAHYLRDVCGDVLNRAAIEITGRLTPVRVLTPPSAAPINDSLSDEPLLPQLPMNADYTFDEFVVGPSNRLAHAACKAICGQPGTLYNPLFIHGGSGLGKSHLLQATCAALTRQHGPRHVLYVSSETFVNDFVRAMGDARLHALREYIRQADALIIDDMQFLAHRESTQEEFFHTFNVLHQSRRQIVLSADSMPSAIPTLEERLVSRLKWGLVCEIEPPNRETREAILHRKAQLRGVELPAEIMEYIADRIPSNIRLLEGALTKVLSECQHRGAPFTLATARTVLDELDSPQSRALRINDILDAVSRHFSIKVAEILSRRRNRSVSHPRQVGMYLARRLTSLSLEEIGAHFGGRNHATVLHADRTIESSRQHDPQVASAVTQLTNALLARR